MGLWHCSLKSTELRILSAITDRSIACIGQKLCTIKVRVHLYLQVGVLGVTWVQATICTGERVAT